MLKNIKSIDQTGIKALIKERLENPEKYVNTPLLIWRADYRDGIQGRILEEAFDEYNVNMSKDDRKWYQTSLLASDQQISYDFTTPEIIRDVVEEAAFGSYKVALMVIEPMFSPVNQESLDRYNSAINSRKVGDVELLPNVHVVSFMCHNHELVEIPENYPNAEQYVFEPDFEEWAKWATENDIYPVEIIDFIRGDGDKEGIIYRWYNFFNTEPEENRAGCDYPEFWKNVRTHLRNKMRKEEINNLADLSEDRIKSALNFCSNISEDVKDAFCKYLVDKFASNKAEEKDIAEENKPEEKDSAEKNKVRRIPKKGLWTPMLMEMKLFTELWIVLNKHGYLKGGEIPSEQFQACCKELNIELTGNEIQKFAEKHEIKIV